MGEPAKIPKLWRWDPAAELFACTHPECPYTHHDPGGVNLHYYKKHGPNPGRETPSASTSRKKDQPKVGAVQKKGSKSPLTHDWRLLNRGNPTEAAAIAKGYSEVCTDCQELR